MSYNVLTWLFSMILVVITLLLAADFVRGWRAGKREARASRPLRDGGDDEKEKVSNLDTAKDAGIDLMGEPRPVFTAKLPPDGKTLHLRTPTKTVADRFETIGQVIQHFEKKQQTLDDLEQLYIFAAMLLANNTENDNITVSIVHARLTPEDVIAFLTAYMDWLTGVIQSKN